MNIVEMILKALSGDTLNKLAAAIGESPESVQKAVAAIVPTLLSGIGGLAAKPEGGEKLWNSLRAVDPKVSDDLGSVLQGGGADELAKKGTGILEDLMGKGGLAALIGPLAAFLSNNTGLVKKLLPLVAPFILSSLGKQVKSGGLDLGGLLKMILAQKGNISKAMPAGLMDSLSGVQGLGDLSSFASDATKAVTAAGTKAVAGASESTNWLVPLVALAALLAAGVWWLNQSKPAVIDASKTVGAGQPVGAGTLGMAPGAQDPAESITKTFSTFVQEASSALESVTDVPTAEAAAPKLTGLTSQIDSLTSLLDDLPESSKAIVSTIVKQGQKTLQEKAEKVLALPGVGEILKPILDGVMEKVTALIKN